MLFVLLEIVIAVAEVVLTVEITAIEVLLLMLYYKAATPWMDWLFVLCYLQVICLGEQSYKNSTQGGINCKNKGKGEACQTDKGQH